MNSQDYNEEEISTGILQMLKKLKNFEDLISRRLDECIKANGNICFREPTQEEAFLLYFIEQFEQQRYDILQLLKEIREYFKDYPVKK